MKGRRRFLRLHPPSEAPEGEDRRDFRLAALDLAIRAGWSTTPDIIGVAPAMEAYVLTGDAPPEDGGDSP